MVSIKGLSPGSYKDILLQEEEIDEVFNVRILKNLWLVNWNQKFININRYKNNQNIKRESFLRCLFYFISILLLQFIVKEILLVLSTGNFINKSGKWQAYFPVH